MRRILFMSVLLTVLGGCSATTLRCGVDGESSFVDLVNLPQDISAQSRYFAELCGFSFDQPPTVSRPVAELTLIDPARLVAKDQ